MATELKVRVYGGDGSAKRSDGTSFPTKTIEIKQYGGGSHRSPLIYTTREETAGHGVVVTTITTTLPYIVEEII